MEVHATNESTQGMLYKSHEVLPWKSDNSIAGAHPMPVIVSTNVVPHVERHHTAIDGARLRARLESIGYGFLASLVSPHIIMAGGSLQQLADHEHNPDAAQVRSFIQVGGTCAARSQALAHFPLPPRKLCSRLLEQPGYLRKRGSKKE
jgi:hypothetical protein